MRQLAIACVLGFAACASEPALIEPRLTDHLLDESIELTAEGELEAALESVDRVLASHPDHAFAYFRRGVTLAEMGRYDAALAAYDRAEELDPSGGVDDPAALDYNRGVCWSDQGMWEEALAAYDRALEHDEAFAKAHDNRAEALLQLLRFDEAEDAARTALELEPRGELSRQLLGVALLNAGDAEGALHEFDVCLDRSPENASHHFNRGLALEDLSRFRDAFAAYSTAVEFAPEHGGARDGVERARQAMLDRP